MGQDEHRGAAALAAGPGSVGAGRRPGVLPSGRAVVGAFLVAVAAVGLFAAEHAASSPPQTRYVVAARPLVAGRTVEPGDVRSVPVALPPGAARLGFTHASSLVGRVLVGNVGAGELVQASALGDPGGAAPGDREVSFAVDPARALGGRISPGDVVDVLATYGEGSDARTEAVLAGARILDRQARGPAGTGPALVYTVAVGRAEDVARLATASATASLTLVRAGAVPPGAGGSYPSGRRP